MCEMNFFFSLHCISTFSFLFIHFPSSVHPLSLPCSSTVPPMFIYCPFPLHPLVVVDPHLHACLEVSFHTLKRQGIQFRFHHKDLSVRIVSYGLYLYCLSFKDETEIQGQLPKVFLPMIGVPDGGMWGRNS